MSTEKKEHFNFKDRTGEKHITNEGYEVEIIEYLNKSTCVIKFEDGHVQTHSYDSIKSGSVRNIYHRAVYGIGYRGFGNYMDRAIYTRWNKFLGRCYSNNIQEKFPTYKGCTVDERWHNFQVFAEWCENNYKDYMQGWHLDKDILVKGNKIYSPETCAFVPQEINTLFTKSNKSRGGLPVGVQKRENRYSATLSKDNKHIALGTYDTPEEAFEAYKIAKEAWIKEVADKWRGQISEEVYQAMYQYQVEITD